MTKHRVFDVLFGGFQRAVTALQRAVWPKRTYCTALLDVLFLQSAVQSAVQNPSTPQTLAVPHSTTALLLFKIINNVYVYVYAYAYRGSYRSVCKVLCAPLAVGVSA